MPSSMKSNKTIVIIYVRFTVIHMKWNEYIDVVVVTSNRIHQNDLWNRTPNPANGSSACQRWNENYAINKTQLRMAYCRHNIRGTI